MNIKKWFFPIATAVLLTTGAVLRSILFSYLRRLSATRYEFEWVFLRWCLAFITEIAFGFVLCLLVTHGTRLLHRFSAVHFVLFLLLCGSFWAAQFYLLYPILPPDQTVTVILNTLAGATLFQAFFRIDSRVP